MKMKLFKIDWDKFEEFFEEGSYYEDEGEEDITEIRKYYKIEITDYMWFKPTELFIKSFISEVEEEISKVDGIDYFETKEKAINYAFNRFMENLDSMKAW